MDDLEIKRKSDSIHIDKENGTSVNYYLFDAYEIHENIIHPHTKQEWHYHTKIEETIIVIAGKLGLSYLVDGKIQSTYLLSGDLVRVMNSTHTFFNDTDGDVRFMVFRFVKDTKDQREVIKNDKTVVLVKE